MPIKKLHPSIQENLQRLGFETLTPFQSLVLPKIKSGANVFGIGEDGVGKTTALVISVIQKLNATALDDVPRALIFVKDRAAALYLEERFNEFLVNTDLRLYAAYEEPNVNKQRDDIYAGVDIVIATPKRLTKLYYMNGINLGRLNMIIVEDAEFLIGNSFHTDINRINESVPKCQCIVFAKKFEPRVEKLEELFMANAQLVEAE